MRPVEKEVHLLKGDFNKYEDAKPDLYHGFRGYLLYCERFNQLSC